MTDKEFPRYSFQKGVMLRHSGCFDHETSLLYRPSCDDAQDPANQYNISSMRCSNLCRPEYFFNFEQQVWLCKRELALPAPPIFTCVRSFTRMFIHSESSRTVIVRFCFYLLWSYLARFWYEARHLLWLGFGPWESFSRDSEHSDFSDRLPQTLLYGLLGLV